MRFLRGGGISSCTELLEAVWNDFAWELVFFEDFFEAVFLEVVFKN